MSWPEITRDEFERGYAERSAMAVDELRNQEHGHFSVVRCDCREEGCRGWKMTCRRELKAAVDGGFALPGEIAELAEIMG